MTKGNLRYLNDIVRHDGIAYWVCDKNFLCCIDHDSHKNSFWNQNKVLYFLVTTWATRNIQVSRDFVHSQLCQNFFLLLALFRIVFQLWVNADNRFWYSIAKRVWERGRSWRQHYIWTQKRLRKLVRDWLIKLERHFILLSYSNFVLSCIIFSYINHAGCTCILKFILN